MSGESDQARLLAIIEKERKILEELRKREAEQTKEIIIKAKNLQSQVDILTDILKGTKATGDTLSRRLYWLNWLIALGTIAMAMVGLFTLWIQLFQK